MSRHSIVIKIYLSSFHICISIYPYAWFYKKKSSQSADTASISFHSPVRQPQTMQPLHFVDGPRAHGTRYSSRTAIRAASRGKSTKIPRFIFPSFLPLIITWPFSHLDRISLFRTTDIPPFVRILFLPLEYDDVILWQ